MSASAEHQILDHQYEITRSLLSNPPSLFNRHAIEVDEAGEVSNFYSAVRSTYYYEESQDFESPTDPPVDELVIEELGLTLWPAPSVIASDGQPDVIGDYGLGLAPPANSLGEHSLRSYTFMEGLKMIEAMRESGRDTQDKEAILAVEEEMRAVNYLLRFENSFRFNHDGLWVALEVQDPALARGQIFVARLALMLTKPGVPGLIPLVFESEGFEAGYLPEDMIIREPWLYGAVSDEVVD